MNKEMVDNIKSWLIIEKEIKELQKLIKEKKTIKKELSSILVDNMSTNEVEEINTNSGKIIKSQQKVKSCISKKFLNQCLLDFYNENPDSKEKLMNFIESNRITTVKEVIKLK